MAPHLVIRNSDSESSVFGPVIPTEVGIQCLYVQGSTSLDSVFQRNDSTAAGLLFTMEWQPYRHSASDTKSSGLMCSQDLRRRYDNFHLSMTW